MTTDHHALRTVLEKLHEQLAQIDHTDPQETEMLRQVFGEINEVLAQQSTTSETSSTTQDGTPAEEDQSLTQRLTHAAEHFEQSHPNIANTISGVIDALGRMGI